MNTEPTVEDCLRELREMFLAEVFRVEVRELARMDEDGEIKRLDSYACVLQPSRGLDGFYSAPTLSEAMAQVRAWYEQQKVGHDR